MDTLAGDCGSRAHRFVREQNGLAATEYAIVLALLVIAVLGVLQLLGGSISNTFSGQFNDVPGATPGG